ncbi:MAG: aromatic ring-hydroxylating dioxygenase subunit alpha [Cyanobacteria bacterium P01_D01_bin.128]
MTTSIHFSTPPVNAAQTTDVRRAPPNLNHWYGVAASGAVGSGPLGVELWQRPIVLYRNPQGQIQAIEDRCPHRNVRLSHGQVEGDRLICAYHGWEIDSRGRCTHVPYLGERQKPPRCRLKTYPVREQDGFIWVFPGDPARAESTPLMGLPEWDHLNYIASWAQIDTAAHYSYLIENLMDMYHGHLHDNYQAWADPVLQTMETSGDRVDAHYQAQSYYRIDKIWSVSQLFIPALRRLHPEPLDVSYVYPHWASRLGEDFKIYCLFCPVNAQSTRAFLVHFTSLNAFHRLHKLPIPFRRWVKQRLFNSARGLLNGLIEQDVLMMEDEQRAYDRGSDRRNIELNPALAKVQKLILSQARAHQPQQIKH